MEEKIKMLIFVKNYVQVDFSFHSHIKYELQRLLYMYIYTHIYTYNACIYIVRNLTTLKNLSKNNS